MQGAATQAMPVRIVEERQRRGCPPAAAPLRAAALGAAAKCKRYSLTGPKFKEKYYIFQMLQVELKLC
jgi:hypothetical protein